MNLIKNEKIIDIIQLTLDYVDPRLICHGKRVAYFAYKMLNHQKKYTDQELRDICILATLHDIGAYKTEEIDKMTIFETVHIWDHSIYGFLFLKYFSPLKKLAPAIMFHHADCKELEHLPKAYRELAQIISICDRADVYLQSSKNPDGLFEYIEKCRDNIFRSDIIDLFCEAIADFDISEDEIYSDRDFMRVLYDTPLTSQETEAYINMLIYSIDFRSHCTVMHTMATATVSEMLGKILKLDKDIIINIKTGAMLHDIGKTGIPVEILEKPGRLNDKEMAIMKTHVEITEKIIEGSVSEEIKRIAVMHHEKLNGTGYPKGIHMQNISLNERIVAVADILSALWGSRSYKEGFSKEKIIGILQDMSNQEFIDSRLVSLVVENYDFITEELDKQSKPLIEIYNKINEDYKKLKTKMNTLCSQHIQNIFE